MATEKRVYKGFDMRPDNKRAAIKVVLTKRADIFLVRWALCLTFYAM